MVVLVNKPEIVRQEDFIDKLKKLKIEKNFKQSALWIQDPFELSHNIAQNVTDSGVKVLKEEFERAKKIAGNLSRHSMSMMKDDESSANLSNSCGSHAFSEGKLPSGTEVDKIDSTISGCAGNDPISINRRNRLIYSLIDLFSVKQSIQDTQWKKRRKAKYVFDIYGSRASSAEKNCYDCSRIAMDILESDLGMQCQVTYRNKDGGSVFEPSKSRKGDLCEETGELINDCSNQISVRSEGADSGECSLGMSQPGVFEDTNEPPRKKIRNETLFSAENFNKLDTVLIKATAWQNTWAKRKCEREFLTPLTDRACWKSESTVTPVSSSSKPESEEVSAESSLSPSNFVSRVDCELRCQSSFKKISHTGTEAEAQSLPRVRDWFPPAQTVSDIPKKSPCMSSDKFSSAGQHSKLSVSLHTLSKRPSEAILVITVRISKSEEQNDEPRCRIVVELEETTNLKFFHTFFAFFKKQILSAFRGHGT